MELKIQFAVLILGLIVGIAFGAVPELAAFNNRHGGRHIRITNFKAKHTGGQELTLSYDIAAPDGEPDAIFSVSLLVIPDLGKDRKDPDVVKITSHVHGDVGNGVEAGTGKTIHWSNAPKNK